MGLINARNLRRAKHLLDKNRHKVGDVVGKAGEKLDQVSKGKTASVTSKAAEAAKKYSDGAVTKHDFGDGSARTSQQSAAMTEAEAQAHAAAAAAAMTTVANAAANLMNNAAVQAQMAQAQQAGADAAKATGDPADPADPPPIADPN